MRQWIYSNHIYLKDGEKDCSLGIENGKIVEVKEGRHPEAISYEGYRIIPGIIDTHIHGSDGYDLSNNLSKEDVLSFLDAIAKHGVTSVFTTLFPNYQDILVDGIVAASKEDSRIQGIHFEGPYLHRVGENGIPTPTRDIDLDHTQSIIEACEGKLKVMGHAPELAGSSSLIQLLKSHQIKAAITHTSADAATAKKAIEEGISVATHTGNVMSGIHHRNVGTLGMVLLSDEVMCEMICDGMHLSLDMISLILKTVGYDRVMMISDCTSLSGLKPGIYDDIIVSEDGFVKTKEGRLMGSSQPVLKGIDNLVNKLNIPLEKVIQMACVNPATFYGLENKGAIEVGYDADLTVLDDDFHVYKTYHMGQIIYPK